MSKMRIYLMMDRAMREYVPEVQIAGTDEVIKRTIRNSISPNSIVGSNPQDYDLFFAGYFDPETGGIGATPPVLVANVKDILTGAAVPLQEAIDAER